MTIDLPIIDEDDLEDDKIIINLQTSIMIFTSVKWDYGRIDYSYYYRFGRNKVTLLKGKLDKRPPPPLLRLSALLTISAPLF